ncbi:lipid A core--O-antigen ligase [Enterovibrio norvegicus]|uniref:Virulence factor membrane-bound polymerase, C-terminal n=2 Tax=Enterovibrio norvegicus TaxID=188144 RepID=A0A1I5R369_9GAMM|nr:lipid A core--O-antigen ligase [Enterovibrio norvegicus]SFP52953.1 Virulence factor membrane-bound polymerase, C-terminal [Enterovibrio norvegicus DSM 15893]
MSTTRIPFHWPSKVASKPLVKPVLIVLATLFLLCFPLNQIPLSVSGIQHPAISTSFMLSVAMICFGGLEVARQHRFSLTKLTGWIALSALLAVLPAFYLHANTSAALWHTGLALLSLLLFITLQQFSFNHVQRQYLLWLPLIAGWIFALPFVVPPLIEAFEHDAPYFLTVQRVGIAKNTTAMVLLTALALSAYLLARTRAYKRTIISQHIVLLLTPLMCITALMALREPWLITFTLLVIALAQPFLFRFSPKLHHGLWNLVVFAAFVIAGQANWLPTNALFAERFSPNEWQLLAQTTALTKTAHFEGVGLGQLTLAQLQFGLSQGNTLPIDTPYPSWLVATITEGGIAIWGSFALLGGLIIKRIADAPGGTRLMLTAIILPSIVGIAATSFVSTNPVLALLFVVLVYWIDNLSARYERINLTRVKLLAIGSTTLLASSICLVVSSIYLGEQALRTYDISDNKLTQYQTHPWWTSFYQQEAGKRAFLENVEHNDKRAQTTYLRQQIRHLSTRPTAEGYQSLIELALLTGDRAIAKQIQQEASALFPYVAFQPNFSHFEASEPDASKS